MLVIGGFEQMAGPKTKSKNAIVSKWKSRHYFYEHLTLTDLRPSSGRALKKQNNILRQAMTSHVDDDFSHYLFKHQEFTPDCAIALLPECRGWAAYRAFCFFFARQRDAGQLANSLVHECATRTRLAMWHVHRNTHSHHTRTAPRHAHAHTPHTRTALVSRHAHTHALHVTRTHCTKAQPRQHRQTRTQRVLTSKAHRVRDMVCTCVIVYTCCIVTICKRSAHKL